MECYDSRLVNSQLEFENILNIDYIKKLVFYICGAIPMYKGTQEIILNGNAFDIISVLIDFYNY